MRMDRYMEFHEAFKKYPGMDTEEMRIKLADKKLVKRIAKRIRQITPRGEKQHCYVCGRYKYIAHLHHPFAVEDLTLFVLFYGLYDMPLYIPTVWLCPNHHAIYHLVHNSGGNLDREVLADISRDELLKISEIERMVQPDS